MQSKYLSHFHYRKTYFVNNKLTKIIFNFLRYILTHFNRDIANFLYKSIKENEKGNDPASSRNKIFSSVNIKLYF